jgi:uncharacterized membrane protein
VINVLAYFLMLKALETQEATRIIPLIQISTLSTILLGIVLLKEKQNVYQKIIAGLLAVIGVYFLT